MPLVQHPAQSRASSGWVAQGCIQLSLNCSRVGISPQRHLGVSPSWKTPRYQQHLSDVPLTTHTTSILPLRTTGISLQINGFQTMEKDSAGVHRGFYKDKTQKFLKTSIRLYLKVLCIDFLTQNQK